MERVAVVYQSLHPEAEPLARRCVAYLDGRGFAATLLSSWDVGPALQADGWRLVITFGGDGTILRVARWVARAEVPIVGVKLGRLGFLSELHPEQLFDGLDPYLQGDYWLDTRTMLRATTVPAPSPARALPVDLAMASTSPPPAADDLLALNDVVISRSAAGRGLHATVEVDGQELAQYTADGVIVATATGSTAYSYAAGGPLLAPELPNLVVTAICPHLHGLRSLVLPPDLAVTIRVSTLTPATLVCDGHVDVPLHDGQAATVRVAAEQTRFARRGARAAFYRALIDKLR
ncbi:MAG TPA: NAD(+)/NADH kinase [Chloroflexota bacterium]|nr:NAD(+)/NADH kinase [Chloroflexota bacterium]